MARIPANPDPSPDSTPVPDPNDARRAAAEALQFDYDTMNEDELGFLDAYISGGLASIDSQQGNPLIPDEPPDPDASLEDGATVADVEDADVRVGADASDDGGVSGGDPTGDDTGTAPTTPATPSAVPDVVMVDLGGGVQMPREQVLEFIQQAQAQSQVPPLTPEEQNILALRRQGLVDFAFVDPSTGQAITPQQRQPVPGQPAQPLEWIDDTAQQAFAAQQAQLEQLAASQRQLLERTVIADQQAIESAISDSSVAFAETHKLEDADMGRVMETLRLSGILPAYRDRFPGDPRTAMSAALEAVYWNIPEYRDREIQKAITANATANEAVNEKKAANAGITSSAGSVARTAPVNPKNREDADKAIVALIEADDAWQARNGSPTG